MSPKIPLLVLSIALLAGCSSGDGEPSSAATPPPPPTSLATTPSLVPQPEIEPEDQTKYVQALGKVDKKLAADGGSMLIKGVETCTDVQQGTSGAALLAKVKQRYGVADDAQAKQIVSATETYICKGLIKPSS